MSPRNSRRALALASVVALLMLIALPLLTLLILGRVDSNQRANTTALCALRADLQNRVSTSDAFLLKHPDGIPGISAATIGAATTNSRRTIKALSPIACPTAASPSKSTRSDQHPPLPRPQRAVGSETPAR